MSSNVEDAKIAIHDMYPKSMEDVPEPARPPTIDASRYLVNGELIEWKGPVQRVESCICFATAEGTVRHHLGDIHLLDKPAAMELLDAAAKQYDNGRGKWPTCTVAERLDATNRFLRLFKAERETVVRLLMWEIGKTRPDCENEFDRTAEYIAATIEAVRTRSNTDSTFITAQGHVAQIRRSPLGVVLSMGPFNYPLNETLTTLIPAIIMGNTVVVKLPRFGCLALTPLLKAFRDSYPPGVVNIFNGRGRETAGPLIQTGLISSLAFIGSAAAANVLRVQHPKPSRMRCTLGLDAKNAAIVLEDADLSVAVKECISGALSFSGQRCTAIKIIFVHSSVADEFVERLSSAVDNLPFGMPWEKCSLSPLPEPDKVKSMQTLVDDAVANGASVRNKLGCIANTSFFFPAVLYPVSSAAKIYMQEQFGPVVPVVPFDSVDSVIDYLADSNYGQQVSVFSTSPTIIGPLFDILVNQVCRVNLNGACKRGPDVFPFTARKDSAEGTLDVESAIRTFSIRTMVAAPINPLNRSVIQGVISERTSQFLTNDILF